MRPRLPFIVLLSAVLLGAVDQTVVAAALPALVLDLGLPINRLDSASWAITAYLAGYALVLPIAGQLADRVRRLDRFLAACLMVFALGSLAAGLGQDLTVIVLGRFVQAIGAGALLPVALGQTRGSDDLARLAVRIGWVTAIAEGGALLGPVYGAGMVHFVSWRWIFLLNIPLSLVIGWLLVRHWPRDARPEAREPWNRLSPLLLGLSLGALIVALSREATHLVNEQGRPMLLGLAAVSAVAFLVADRRAASPLLPSSLMRQRAVPVALLTHLLAGAAFMIPLVVVPLWGSTLLGRAPAEASLLLARLTLTIPLGALLASRLGGRLPLSWLASLGMLICLAGALMMTQWSVDTDETAMTPALLLAGLGFGIMIVPTNTLAIGASGLGSASTAASLVQVARLIGMTIASAALATYGLDRFDALVANLSLTDPEAYLNGVRASADLVFSDLFRASAVLAALAAAVALAAPGRLSQTKSH